MAGDRDAPYQKGRTKILDPQVFDGLEHLRPWIIWVPPRVSPIVPMVNRCKWHPTILAILQYRLMLPKASATRAGQSQAPFFTAEVLFRWMICPSKNKQRTADRKCDLSRAQSHLLTAQAPSGGKPVFSLSALRLRQSKPAKKPFRHSQLIKTKKDGVSQVTPGPLRSNCLSGWLTGLYTPV